MNTNEKEIDLKKFLHAINEYKNSHDINRLCEKTLPLTCDEYRVHYLKSFYYKKNKDRLMAIKELNECLTSLKNIKTYDSCVELDDCSFLLIDNGLDSVISKRRVLFYAGETYAQFGMENESLEAYKQYQIESRLKSHHEPFLYSFRPINEYTLSDLINNELTLVHPKEFNDPFDTLIYHWIEGIDSRCKEKKHVPIYKKSFEYYRVRSFVKDKSQNKAYKNILMWSHYANNHKGICIKYKFQKPFTERTNCNMYFRPITYVNNKHKVNLNIGPIDSELSYCTKNSTWKYENEIRLIAYMPDAISHFSVIPMGSECTIEAVYFGKRCDEHSIRTIKAILRSTNVHYYKMVSEIDDIFNLNVIPV